MENKTKTPLTGYPSIDKPWYQYYPWLDKNEELELPQMTMYQLAKERNKTHKKDIALDVRTSKNDFKKGIKITYRKFFKIVDRLAKNSTALGVKPNEIMPIILPNVPEARTFIYSNSKIGATSYPISPLLPNNTLEAIIKDNNIKNLVIFSGFYEKFKSALENCALDSLIYLDGTESLPNSIRRLNQLKNQIKGINSIPKGDQILSWDEYRKLGRFKFTKIKEYPYDPNHVAIIMGTSGTTGTSKGVCMTDDNINAAALSYIISRNFEGTFLDALLPSIGYGASMSHLQIAGSYTTYLVPELVTDKIATLIQNTKPDNFPGGPVHSINMLDSAVFKDGTAYRPKNFISGGASLNKEVERKLNGVDENYTEIDINDYIFTRQGWALTESVAVGTYNKRGTYKFGSVGIPLPGITVSIFKPDTDEELKYGEPGEICLTGPTVMKGYLNNPEETAKVIKVHRDGKKWIHTKDIGYMEEDGHLFFKERIKNIFMRTGFNVHPNKIAEYLNTSPYIKNCYVAGFDHPTEQCVPVAFIELENNVNKPFEEIEQELKQDCIQNLEETSVPYGFVFVDKLPINAGGKIDDITIRREAGIDFVKQKELVKKNLQFKK